MRVTKGSSMSHDGSKQSRPDTLTALFRNYEASSSPGREVFVTWDRISLQSTSSSRRSIAEDHETHGKVYLRSSEVLEISRDIALASDSVPAWPFSDEPLRKQRNQFGVPS